MFNTNKTKSQPKNKLLYPLALLLLFGLAGAAPSRAQTTAPHWEMPQRAQLNQMAANLTANLKPWTVPARSFVVENYGALADGKTPEHDGPTKSH